MEFAICRWMFAAAAGTALNCKTFTDLAAAPGAVMILPSIAEGSIPHASGRRAADCNLRSHFEHLRELIRVLNLSALA
jgi:hypothetical protein